MIMEAVDNNLKKVDNWTWWGVEKKTHLGVHLLLVVAGAEGRKDQVSVVHNLGKDILWPGQRFFYNLGKVFIRKFESLQKYLQSYIKKNSLKQKYLFKQGDLLAVPAVFQKHRQKIIKREMKNYLCVMLGNV